MARTGPETISALPESKLDEGRKNGSESTQIHYDFRQNGGRILLSVAAGLITPVTVPVQHVIGVSAMGSAFCLNWIARACAKPARTRSRSITFSG
jgi:hypothetical protein